MKETSKSEQENISFATLLKGKLLNDKELARFVAKLKLIDSGYHSFCWEWQGTQSSTGHGKVKIRRINQQYIGCPRIVMAHCSRFDLQSPLLYAMSATIFCVATLTTWWLENFQKERGKRAVTAS